MITACIGLGSNLDDPQQQVLQAFDALADIPCCGLRKISSLYQSQPIGPQDQADFINAVAVLDTTLPALELLDALQKIERHQGRKRGVRWGPRTLDLDLLLYGDEIIHVPRLQVPHPQLAQRRFVLQPLLECMPDIIIPGQGRADALLNSCSPQQLKKL